MTAGPPLSTGVGAQGSSMFLPRPRSLGFSPPAPPTEGRLDLPPGLSGRLPTEQAAHPSPRRGKCHQLGFPRLSSPPEWAAEPLLQGKPAPGGRRGADTSWGGRVCVCCRPVLRGERCHVSSDSPKDRTLPAPSALGGQKVHPRHRGALPALEKALGLAAGGGGVPLSGCSLLCCSPSELQGPLDRKGPGHLCARPGLGICARLGHSGPHPGAPGHHRDLI